VFEPFFTTKEIGKGTGLGLSQIHGFAAQAGGRAEIDSPEGEGATLRVYLPRTGKPLLISTGMATLAEIEEAILAAKDAGAKQIALLKCTSAYPYPPFTFVFNGT